MPPFDEQTHPAAGCPPLPAWALSYVGGVHFWQEHEDSDAEAAVLVLGARWARQPGSTALLGIEAVQFLLEREDGSSRWSAPQRAPEGAPEQPPAALEADLEGPEQGHTWRFTVEGRTAGPLPTDDAPDGPYTDSPYFSGEVWTLEVRGWSLKQGLLKAAALGLGAWRRPSGKRLDEA